MKITQFVSHSGIRVYRIGCLAFAGFPVRVFLVLGAGVPTLVDAGSGQGDCSQQILAGLAEVGEAYDERFAPSDIRRLIITHAHIDHFGGVVELLEHLPAEVAIHPLDAGPVAGWEEHSFLARRRLAAFLDEAGVLPARRESVLAASGFDRRRLQSVPVSRWLADGDELDGLRIIHTPGHSSGHICIGVDNLLLTADHILARTVPQQWPGQLAPYLGLAHYLDSLDKIARMKGFTLGIGSHEAAIENIGHRIDVIRQSHERRCQRILSYLGQSDEPLSIAELTPKMFGESSGFRQMLALTDVGARVEYLHQLGRVMLVNLDEVESNPQATWRFRPRVPAVRPG